MLAIAALSFSILTTNPESLDSATQYAKTVLIEKGIPNIEQLPDEDVRIQYIAHDAVEVSKEILDGIITNMRFWVENNNSDQESLEFLKMVKQVSDLTNETMHQIIPTFIEIFKSRMTSDEIEFMFASVLDQRSRSTNQKITNSVIELISKICSELEEKIQLISESENDSEYTEN